MKKLIISAITAAALLFGFAGCSGDLHDNEKMIIDLSAGGAPGDFDEPANWSEKEPWTTSDVKTGTYTLSFKTKAKIPADGIGFKINSQLAWGVDGYTEFTVAADGDAATAKFMAGSAMAGAGNAFITGCKPSTAYKMTVVCNPDTTATVKVETADAASSAPVPYYLDGYAVRSLDAAWNLTAYNLLYNPTEDKATGNLTYKLDFIASAGSQQLAIARKDWTEGRWECSEAKSFAVGAEPIFLESGKEQHPTVTGLTVDNPYRIYVYTTPEKKVSMKVVGLTNVEVTPTVSVTGLPEALNGTTLYFTGDFNGWKEPSKEGSIECKVTGGSVSVTLPKVSKAFETGEAQEFSYQGKFASAGWKKPEITNDAGENISFKVTSDKHTVKGTFKTTKEKEGTQYLCDWTVE